MVSKEELRDYSELAERMKITYDDYIKEIIGSMETREAILCRIVASASLCSMHTEIISGFLKQSLDVYDSQYLKYDRMRKYVRLNIEMLNRMEINFKLFSDFMEQFRKDPSCAPATLPKL